MTTRRPIARAIALTIGFGLAGLATAADVGVTGTKLVLRDTNRAARLVFVSKDAQLRLPGPTLGPDQVGARITVLNPLTATTATLELPEAGWRPNRAGTVFRYNDGLVKALFRDGRRTKVRVLTTMIPISGSSQGRLGFVFEIGDQRFCTLFDEASVRRDVPCRFVAKRAAAPPACPSVSGSPIGAFVASQPSTANGHTQGGNS